MNYTMLTGLGKPKKFGRIIAIFLLINTVILLIFNYNDGIKGIKATYDRVTKPALSLELSSAPSINTNSYLQLNYSAPDKGFLSLWNWNSRGQVKIMIKPFELDPNNRNGNLKVRATDVGMEHVIMLWSQKPSQQLKQQFFESGAAFDSALKAKKDVLHDERKSVQIYN